jgi:transposase
LNPWASRRRLDLLELLDRLNPMIADLSQAIEQEQEAESVRGSTTDDSSRCGALTALAFVLIIGDAERFHCGKHARANWRSE